MRATKNKRNNRYQLIFRATNGKRVYFTSKEDFPEGLTQHKADLIATELYQNFMHDQEKQAKAALLPTLEKCVMDMLEHKRNEGVKGMRRLEKHADMALKWNDNNTIEDIATVANRMKKDMMSRVKANGEKYKNSYVIKLLDVYTATANLAFDEWRILKYPLGQQIKRPRLPSARDRYLTRAELSDILMESDPYLKSIITFHVLTGIRTEELQRIQPHHLTNNMLTIDGKNGKKRSLYLQDEVMAAIAVFGLPVSTTPDRHRALFRKAANAAGVKDIVMHDLRHTFATWLRMEQDIPMDKLQLLLGHSTADQTMKYTHLSTKDLRGTSERLSILSAPETP